MRRLCMCLLLSLAACSGCATPRPPGRIVRGVDHTGEKKGGRYLGQP